MKQHWMYNDVTSRYEKSGVVEAMEQAVILWGCYYEHSEDYERCDINQVVDWICEHQMEFEAVSDWRRGGVPEFSPDAHDVHVCTYCGIIASSNFSDATGLERLCGTCNEHMERYLYESGEVFHHFEY